MSKPIYGDTVGGGGTNLKKVPQSDWNQADQTQLDFIKNKPDIYTKSEVDDLLANVEAGNVNVQEIVDAAVDVARTEAANQDAVVLAEVQAAVEAAKVEAANQDAVVLAESQVYANQAKADAIADAEGKVNALANGQVKINKEAIEAINNESTGILKQAKDYADSLVDNYAAADHDHVVADITDFDEKVKAYGYATTDYVDQAEADAVATAKTELEGKITSGDEATLTSANAYADEVKVAAIEAAKVEAANQDVVVLAEVQANIDAARVEIANQDAATLAEAQGYTNTEVAKDRARLDTLEEIVDDIPVPEVADSGKYLRVNASGEWDILAGDPSGGGGSGEGTVTSATYTEYISSGETDITVEAANNTIFSIQGYTSVTITVPAELNLLSIWECYFYIHFSDSTNVSLTLPSDMRCNGDGPNYVKPGDIWEISINKQGGAVCLRT